MLEWYTRDTGPDQRRAHFHGHFYGIRFVSFYRTKRWERTTHEIRALFYEHGDMTHAVVLGCFMRTDMDSAVRCCESHAASLILEQLG